MSESKSSSGVGFVSILQLMFIGLKLCNQVQWSWWLVFSPFLSVAALLALLFGFCLASVITRDVKPDKREELRK